MRPRLALIASALLLAAILPTTASADAAVRFEEHHIGFFCDEAIDGGFVSVSADATTFGNFARADVWLDPAIPFEDPPSLSGSTEEVTLTPLAAGFDLEASFEVFDLDGLAIGEATIAATLTPSGEPELLSGGRDGNRQTHVEGTFQAMDVGATLALPEMAAIDLGSCAGDETHIKVLETNPRAFVTGNAGVAISCFWESGDSAASLFAIDDRFGPFADAGLFTADMELFTASSQVDITAESLNASFEFFDGATGEPAASATAGATFAPLGDPVTSIILSSSSRDKVVEQRLLPSGELAFSTGHTFPIDPATCFANTFDSHAVFSPPAGPKPGGRSPVNDTPDGALPLAVGSSATAKTNGAAIEPELVPTTCGFGDDDKMGRTVWYTIEGTGDDVTVDTAGSNFDTVMAVYQLVGEELVELACLDDVFFDPIGLTFQAAITGPTEEGATYYVQIGGFDARDRGGDVEFGVLKVAVRG